MARDYLEAPSWQKTRIVANILRNANNTKEFQLYQLQTFILKYTESSLKVYSKEYLIEFIPLEERDNFHNKYRAYLEALNDTEKVLRYLKRIMNSADDVNTVKLCIPEHYWTYLEDLECDGELDHKELYDHKCFEILEQAPMNNLLLGITN